MTAGVIWHDVECGSYAADLDAWSELAADAGPVLELGCGTGRVALHLARQGHEVWGVDTDPALVATAGKRAERKGLSVRAIHADAIRLDLGPRFGLVIAAMQLIQMVGDEPARAEFLRAAARQLRPEGRFAAAILDGVPSDLDGAPAPLPDVREVDGRVYSSLPVDVAVDGDRLELRRLRQEVEADGALTDSEHTESLWVLDPARLEAEAEAVGMAACGRVHVPAADGYVGAVIVVVEGP